MQQQQHPLARRCRALGGLAGKGKFLGREFLEGFDPDRGRRGVPEPGAPSRQSRPRRGERRSLASGCPGILDADPRSRVGEPRSSPGLAQSPPAQGCCCSGGGSPPGTDDRRDLNQSVWVLLPCPGLVGNKLEPNSPAGLSHRHGSCIAGPPVACNSLSPGWVNVRI